VVIDAPPEAVMDALADVGAAPTWSSVHRHSEVIDRYPDGRPHHVKVTVRVMGITDHEVREYHWGRDWVVWDVAQTAIQHDQHVEYTVRPEEGKTRVRFDITLEPYAPVPVFLIKRAKKMVLHDAIESLRKRVMSRLEGEAAPRKPK
jgi:hypothetical protein